MIHPIKLNCIKNNFPVKFVRIFLIINQCILVEDNMFLMSAINFNAIHFIF
jgi:hypothetical protein